MSYIPGKLNPADVLAEPLTWALNDRHARRIMGHFSDIHHSTDSDNLQSSNSRSGEGVDGDDAILSPNPSLDACHHLQGQLDAQFEMSMTTLSFFPI